MYEHGLAVASTNTAQLAFFLFFLAADLRFHVGRVFLAFLIFVRWVGTIVLSEGQFRVLVEFKL